MPDAESLHHTQHELAQKPNGEGRNSRRTRMDGIPCRNFDYGDGHCPFGSSCFYAHVYRDGVRESHEIRKTTDAEGNLKIVGGARLSDWLDTKQGRRALR